ncbi:MAG: pyruvate formate lyase family protein [Planctomycetota bacterium]
MNERLNTLRDRVRRRDYKKYRLEKPPVFIAEFNGKNLSWPKRISRLTRRTCQAQKVVIEPEQRIVFIQTAPLVGDVYTSQDWRKFTENKTLHEGVAVISNICPDWNMVLSQGLLGRKEVALATKQRLADNPKAVEFLDCAIETIDATLDLVKRYADKARQLGRNDIAEILENVPAKPPATFHEALQFFRFAYAIPWFIGHYQIGLGRFDQYMWPYLKKDLDAGKIDIPEAEELLAEFFISLNIDTDIFPGVQPGDNGQTLTLGGVKSNGANAVNELTEMILRLDCDVAMIDPKINLRISADTDMDLLSLATRLTSKGLGFPQYLNDDIIIPALVDHGYDIEDAREYTVAACWEVIIPGKGLDYVNIGAVSFPAAADKAIRQALAGGKNFETILQYTKDDIKKQLDKLLNDYSRLLLGPSPYLSLLMDDCLETGHDLSEGLKYNNFGVHGACIANAADALAATKRFIFEEQSIAPSDLLSALDADYEGYETIYNKLSNEGPKVGNNDDYVDTLMVRLFEYFADACEKYGKNNRGGTIRPGAATAMYYIWLAQGCPGMREPLVAATADGRKKNMPFGANLAPSPGVSVAGPISVLQSFSKIDFRRIYNGGPITMEFSDTVFRNDEAIQKVAMFIRSFAHLGGQQLQINTLNRERLRDAKKHPKQHQDLVVRVWGWSGYFCELAPEYQDQIIARNVYQV